MHRSLLKLFLLSCGISLSRAKNETPSPHIILILADDLGWNDVSFHGSPEIPTPNIDALALNGIILNSLYGEYMCTPSRAAMLTGKYPMRMGLQHFVLKASERSGLPLNETILPQHLKELGYSTHMVGKWHLGFFKKSYFPTYRGFDSFFGYLTGKTAYYDYTDAGETNLKNRPMFMGINLYNGTTPVRNFRGQYATHVFSDKARKIILNHNTSKPLFLYLSHLAPHTGNANSPLEAPPEIISKFKHIKNINRRIYAGMVSALDDSVGTVVEALDEAGILQNSIIIFSSDNGGEWEEALSGASSNYPLRGSKTTFWEGGVRLSALMWSPLLQLQEPRVSQQLMHISDWTPTLYRAAGGDPADLGEMDGVDMWSALRNGTASPRKTVLHTLDPIWGLASLRMGQAKLVRKTTNFGNDRWVGRSGLEDMEQPHSLYDYVFEHGCRVEDILRETGKWIARDPDQVYNKSRVVCQSPPPEDATSCDPLIKDCLFFVEDDPCEYYDVSDAYPQLVDEISSMISMLEEEAVLPQSKNSDPLGDPMCYNFTYVPWLDPEFNNIPCNFAEELQT